MPVYDAPQCTAPRDTLQETSDAFNMAVASGLESPVASQVLAMAGQLDILLQADPGDPVCIWTTLLWSVGNMAGELAGIFAPTDMPTSAALAQAALDCMTAAADNLPCV